MVRVNDSLNCRIVLKFDSLTFCFDLLCLRRLSLYPNGCKDRNGNGHISLYLRILETKTFSPNWEINVNFKLFVLDQIRDKYLTIQGIHLSIKLSFNLRLSYKYTCIIRW